MSGPLAGAPYGNETLGRGHGDYDTAIRKAAEAAIVRYARDEADLALLSDAVFGEMRKTRYHGSKPSQEWGRARSEWLGRCRDWVESTTGRVLRTSQIPKADQLAYEVATGNVWAPPGPAQPRADGNKEQYRHPVPTGEAGAAYRTRVRAWGRKQGWRVHPRGPIEVWLLNRYVDATGDVYVEPGPRPLSLVPVGPARRHLKGLNEAGMGQEAIAAAVPMSIGAVNMMLRGRAGRGEQTRIRYETEQRILAVRIAAVEPGSDAQGRAA